MVFFNSRLDIDGFTEEDFEIFYTDVGTLSYEYREAIKHLYNDYGEKIPVKCKIGFAKQKLLAYYLRSLEASDFSAEHPCFGAFAAAFISKCDWDAETEAALRIEYGVSPLTADLHFDKGSSYWNVL